MRQSYSFGEVLLDCFEKKRLIGGAPLNFAWNLNQFGLPVSIVSAIGRDDDGLRLRQFVREAGIDASYLMETTAPTGTVTVTVTDGEPEFLIDENAAWDHIDSDFSSLSCPGVVYFGTLAQRSKPNRHSLSKLLGRGAELSFFDVKLRQQFYTDDMLLSGMKAADIVKFNEEEWEVAQHVTGEGTLEGLLETYELQAVACTLGKRGAILVSRQGRYEAPAEEIPVVDTVGAGDAFSAALAAGWMRSADSAFILRTACAAGKAVVQHAGGQIRLPEHVASAFGGGGAS